jgi:hypothetical protein
MAKIIRFKQGHSQTNWRGQLIGPHNLTPELHKAMVEDAPAFADLFEEVDEEPVKDAKSKTSPAPAKTEP